MEFPKMEVTQQLLDGLAGGTYFGTPQLLFQSKEDLNRWSSVSAVDLFEAVLAMLQTTLRSAGMDQQTRFS